MIVSTVGELMAELQKHDPNMPLWMSAEAYTHEGRVFNQIRPNRWRLQAKSEDKDGNEVVEYRGISIGVNEEEYDGRSVKGKDGKWKHEPRKFLCLDNAYIDEWELADD